jgi:serine/threonine protein kinase
MTVQDEAIAEVTTAMQAVRIPSDGEAKMITVELASSAASSLSNSLPPKPQEEVLRPFDVVCKAGPAENPIPFPRPVFDHGRRDNVLCYEQRSQRHLVAKNVLFRDFSREFGDDRALQRVERAYWTVPHKEPIPTIMGHVNICHVLTRCRREENDSSDSEDEIEEDIVFQVTNEYVAIKVNYLDRMERLRNKHAEDPLKEIAAMQLIGHEHPNVLRCIEVLLDRENLYVVMPYCGSGDLFHFLQEAQRLNTTTPGLPEPEARFLFRQVMAGLRHLHYTKGICHRDISPENIMMDGKGCLIIDMGMCLRVPYTDPNGDKVTDILRGTRKRLLKPQGACGKLPYMSPEIYKSRDDFDGEAVDVWTAGTIMFCMLTGNRSYEMPHKSDPQFYWMTHDLNVLMNGWGVDLSDEAMDLLRNMLQIDPRLRLTIDEVEKHAWFAQPDALPPGCK